MIISKDEGSVFEYLTYSSIEGYDYHADVENCPESMYQELREFDVDMALDGGHCIDNWQEIPS